MMLVVKALGGLLILYLLMLVGARYLQRHLMYFPDTARVTPASAGLADVEELILETPDGHRIVSWYGRAAPGQPTVLYFHGNAGALACRSERIRKYLARGLGMFMMTYRGFGGSTGQPSEHANVADGLIAFDTLVAAGVAPSDIIIYGESIGTGVAAQVAAQRPAAGLILDAPYTSMADLARLHYPILPARHFLTDRYENDMHIHSVKVPLLIVHGGLDDIIPVSMGRAIYDAANEPKEIVVLPDAGHSDHFQFGSYDAIFAWIDRVRRS